MVVLSVTASGFSRAVRPLYIHPFLKNKMWWAHSISTLPRSITPPMCSPNATHSICSGKFPRECMIAWQRNRHEWYWKPYPPLSIDFHLQNNLMMSIIVGGSSNSSLVEIRNYFISRRWHRYYCRPRHIFEVQTELLDEEEDGLTWRPNNLMTLFFYNVEYF